MHEQLDWIHIVIYVAVSIFLFCFAGLMSGLTLGLLSLDPMSLKILKKAGTKTQKKYARRMAFVLKNPHWLLATLLICNAIALEALPIMLNKLVGEVISIILSVSLILIFGEIIPQAICQKFGLAIGGNLWWLVLILMIIVSPIGWPISVALDCILGKNHVTFFRRQQLKELITIHGRENHFGKLSKDEVNVIKGALDLKEKTVIASMTPLNLTFCLNWNDKLDMNEMKKVIKSGHSRIPVYKGKNRGNIIGLLLTKRLIILDPDDSVVISSLEKELRDVPFVQFDTPLWEVLKMFSGGRSHMGVVKDSTNQTLGIITLEDIIEELLGKEIVDETDEFIDIQNQIRVVNAFKRKYSRSKLSKQNNNNNNNNNNNIDNNDITIKINNNINNKNDNNILNNNNQNDNNYENSYYNLSDNNNNDNNDNNDNNYNNENYQNNEREIVFSENKNLLEPEKGLFQDSIITVKPQSGDIVDENCPILNDKSKYYAN